jgi:type IV pilus assembly protein PilN
MLKINLLPIRQLKKRAQAARQLFGIVLLFVGTLAVLTTVGVIQAQRIDGLESDIVQLNKQKDSFAPTLKKIAELKKDKEEINRKTEIIKQLKTDSSLTVRVLDEVANKVDNQRMWLESLQQDKAALKLTGIALDDQTVAQFMDNLKASPFVQDVALSNSSQKAVAGTNLKSFELICTVSQPVVAKSEPKSSK